MNVIIAIDDTLDCANAYARRTLSLLRSSSTAAPSIVVVGALDAAREEEDARAA
jgi:hypothetical protein